MAQAKRRLADEYDAAQDRERFGRNRGLSKTRVLTPGSASLIC